MRGWWREEESIFLQRLTFRFYLPVKVKVFEDFFFAASVVAVKTH